MMKLVRKPKHVAATPVHTRANRELTTLELATSFVDAEGMIDPEEGIDRVFKAAALHGEFRVNWDVRRGTRKQVSARTYPEAMVLAIALIKEGKRPLLYAAISNRDALISAKAYRDKEGRWVSRNEAISYVYERYFDMWCEMSGQKLRCPALYDLRPKRRVKRERL